MNPQIKKIMLVTNAPSNTAGAEQTAINLAKEFKAEVLLVDSIKTPFHAPRSPKLSTEIIYETAIAAKETYLAEVKQRFQDAGVAASTKVLVGTRTSTELIRTVVEDDCDLVIRYLKGQSSRDAGRFGQTAENLMRACPVPVLLTEKEILNPKVVACINLEHGPEENQAILESARGLAESAENLSVISCWAFAGRECAFEYMDEGLIEQTKDEAAELFTEMTQRLCKEYDLDELGERLQLLNANPISAIPKYCSENSIDIAVMCSASLNHPLGRKLGSTIERTIGSLPCALLAVKPIGFQTVDQVLVTKQAQLA